MPKEKRHNRADRRYEWHFRDLITDPTTGRLKETLVFSVSGKAAALGWFSYKCYYGDDTEWLWLIVMGVLTMHAAFSQFVTTRFGNAPTSLQPPKGT